MAESMNDRYELLSPFIDILEISGELRIDVEIPGIRPEDLDVTICRNSISIEGEIRCEDESGDTEIYQRERRYGCFHKKMRLPVPVKHDMALADYQNGILKIRIPKEDTEKNRATQLKLH